MIYLIEDAKCWECGTELTEDDVKVIGITSGVSGLERSLDIIWTCPECGTRYNAFQPVSCFHKLED